MQDSRLRASADQQLLHDADRFIKKKDDRTSLKGKHKLCTQLQVSLRSVRAGEES